MIFPVQAPWRLTTEFNEARPLSQPVEKRTHPHAAWDIAVPVNTEIVSPEAGMVYYFVSFRPSPRQYWPGTEGLEKTPSIIKAFRNYSYSIFGGCILLLGRSGLTHLFTHTYLYDLIDDIRKMSAELYGCTCNARRSHMMLYTTGTEVQSGEHIGRSGNAGWSTGAHIHYEIHKTPWEIWEKRPDPKKLYPKEWDKHKTDLTYDWQKEELLWIEGK